MSDNTARLVLRKFIAWSLDVEAEGAVAQRRTFAEDLAAQLRSMHGSDPHPPDDDTDRVRQVAVALIDRVIFLATEMDEFGGPLDVQRPSVEQVAKALHVFSRPVRRGRPRRGEPAGARAAALADVWLAFGLVAGAREQWIDAARKVLERDP